MKTPFSSMVLVSVGSFIGSFGAVFLKIGAARLRGSLVHFVLNPGLAAGAFMYLLSTCFFIVGVKNGQLSVLFPLVSLGYVWTMLWSKLFFKEPLTRNKVLGLSLILVGVTCIGFGNS